jgi:hypothetical protein
MTRRTAFRLYCLAVTLAVGLYALGWATDHLSLMLAGVVFGAADILVGSELHRTARARNVMREWTRR